MRMGVDYYPEHWDRSLWDRDAELMKATGVKLVRVAEFAWSRLEPAEGRFDFAWLDDAIDLFHRHGIQVILGTPTNCPPTWMIEQFPDIVQVDANRRRCDIGVRGHRCYNSPSLHVRTTRIVSAMAERYGKHPAVVAWQIDNEFMHLGCHCDFCQAGFRSWLQKKYGTVEALNAAWGAVVWSGEVNAWSQVTTPLGGTQWRNPSKILDWQRFESDSVAAFQRLQVGLIKAKAPTHPVTHNIWSYPMALDYQRLAKDLDVISLDYYPTTNPDKADTSPYGGALTLDLTRGLKRQGFWIMETLSGSPGCWMPMWRTPRPGLMRVFGWQMIARGADAVVHFRWRSATVGGEQFWHGLLDHSNIPGRRFAEYQGLVAEVNRLAPEIAGSVVVNQAAILHSHEIHNAFQQQPQADNFDYFDTLRIHHRALTRLGVGMDALDVSADLSGYRLVVAPAVFLADVAMAKRFDAFVQAGGTLVLTCRSGVKTPGNVCWMQALPGPFADMAGVTVSEYDPLGKHPNTVKRTDGSTFGCSVWADLLKPGTAEVVATYDQDFFAGTPAVTANRRGKGLVIYAGTQIEESFWADQYRTIVDDLGLDRVRDLPDGVQVSERRSGAQRFRFILNLSTESRTVAEAGTGTSLLDGRAVTGSLTLPSYGVEIIRLAL